MNGTYNVGQYVNEASLVIDQEFESKQHVILCGGTGLYIKALIEGIDYFWLGSPGAKKTPAILSRCF